MRVFIIFLVCLAELSTTAFAQAGRDAQSFLTMARNIDLSCLKMEVLGPCADPMPGVYLRYWEPSLVMETVKAPGDYVIQEIGPLVGPVVRKAAEVQMTLATGIDDVPLSSSSGWQSVGSSNLHFHEVHLYNFPLKLLGDIVLCPAVPNNTLGIHYVSEADSPQWRMQVIEKHLPQVGIAARSRFSHVGNWGPLYPRTGFVIGASSAVTSALDALRAVSIAGEGIATGHVVEAPLGFQMDMNRDKMQMLYPEKTMCMPPGTDARLWEPGRVSKNGAYVWLYWHYRECCKSIVPK